MLSLHDALPSSVLALDRRWLARALPIADGAFGPVRAYLRCAAGRHPKFRSLASHPNGRDISRKHRVAAYKSGSSSPHHPYNQQRRSAEHTSELQSLMRISYAVFCLKKKIKQPITTNNKLTLHPLNINTYNVIYSAQ